MLGVRWSTKVETDQGKLLSSLFQTMLPLDLYSMPNILFAGSQAEILKKTNASGKNNIMLSGFACLRVRKE